MHALATAEDPEFNVGAAIRAIPGSTPYRRKCLNFAGLESRSLLSPKALAFLHETIQVVGATSVLEIGTYFAGGTKVLADAVQGRGVVVSVDSNAARAPYVEAEIATWPQALQEATMFLPHSAEQLFSTFSRKKEIWFDLCVVDGDHRHTAALVDLLNCARFAAPGAVILVDDSTQPAVFHAVKDFLALRPDWQEIGGAIEGHRTDAAFSSLRSSCEGLPFLVLVGPEHPPLGRRLHTLGGIADGPLQGIEIDLARPAPAGTFQGRFVLSYTDLKQPHMLQADASTDIVAGARTAVLRLAHPLVAETAQPVSIDVSLCWHGPDADSVLALARPPRFLIG